MSVIWDNPMPHHPNSPSKFKKTLQRRKDWLALKVKEYCAQLAHKTSDDERAKTLTAVAYMKQEMAAIGWAIDPSRKFPSKEEPTNTPDNCSNSFRMWYLDKINPGASIPEEVGAVDKAANADLQMYIAWRAWRAGWAYSLRWSKRRQGGGGDQQ